MLIISPVFKEVPLTVPVAVPTLATEIEYIGVVIVNGVVILLTLKFLTKILYIN